MSRLTPVSWREFVERLRALVLKLRLQADDIHRCVGAI